jgi:hypothetical protein
MNDRTTSEEFLQVVGGLVAFGDGFPEDADLRNRIVRATVLDSENKAADLIRSNSALCQTEAEELVKRICASADEVFYLTGLRPQRFD